MKKRDKINLAIIIGLSFLIKIIYLFGSGAFHNPEIFEYDLCAKNLLEGNGFYYEHLNTRYYAGIAPGFPILCFFIYKIFGYNPLWIIYLQIFVASLLAIPIWFIASKVFNKQTAALAAILVALFPPLIIYSTRKVHNMSLYSFLFSILLLSFFSLRERSTLKRALLAGFICGLAILFRITAITFVLFALFWYYFFTKEPSGHKLRISLAVLLVSGSLLLPWGIRNYLIFGRPVIFQTNNWECLWFGNMPGSGGNLYSEDGRTMFELGKKDLPPNFFEENELKQGMILKNLTLGYLQKDPWSFCKRVVIKFFKFWYISPEQGRLYPYYWKLSYSIYYSIIFFLAVCSISSAFFSHTYAHKKEVFLILLLFFTMAASHSIYYAEGRHRWAIEPLLLIFSANGFILLKEAISKIIARR